MNAQQTPRVGIGFATAAGGGRRAALARWPVVALVMVCLFSGCISRPPLNVRSFAFSPPSASKPSAGFQTHRVIAIRSLRVAAPFDRRSLVYRLDDYAYESDPYAEFFMPASEGLLVPMRSYLRQAGAFEAVVEPGSALKPNTVAEISVLELYGDFRKSQQAAAVLKLRVLLFDSPNGIPGKLVLEREYSRGIPLKARTPDALMAGWNEALAQIMGQLVSDVGGMEPALRL